MSERITYAVIIHDPLGMILFPERFYLDSSVNENVQWLIYDCCDPREEVDPSMMPVSYRLTGAGYEKTVRSLKKWDVDYVKLDPATPSAECYNRALEKADGTYICFTNQEMFYEGDTTARIRAAADKYPEEPVLSVIPRQRNPRNRSKMTGREETELRRLEDCRQLDLFPHACFFKAEWIRGERFYPWCEEETSFAFLLQAALQSNICCAVSV